jgi:hypothetical protein
MCFNIRMNNSLPTCHFTCFEENNLPIEIMLLGSSIYCSLEECPLNTWFFMEHSSKYLEALKYSDTDL